MTRLGLGSSAQTPDPYAVLGVARDATPAEITAAYRRLLRRHHPDLRPGPGGTERREQAWASDAALQDVLCAYSSLRGRRPGEPVGRAEDERDVGARRPSSDLAVAWLTAPGRPEPHIRVGPVRWHSRSPAGHDPDPDPRLELLAALLRRAGY